MGPNVNNIVVQASEFDAELWKLTNIIKNPKLYYDTLNQYRTKLKEEFPLLNIVYLPTNSPTTAFIQGLLLPKNIIDKCHLDQEQFNIYGLPILAVIPEFFTKEGVFVYDACGRICWDNIPIEYRHCIPLIVEKNQKRRICTHNSKDININNCIIDVLHSAYNLFIEYMNYQKTSNFKLRCLPHGIEKD